MNTAKKIERVTLEEFETMEKDERFNYELIDGVVMMSPSPSRGHQKIEVNLIRKLGTMLDGTPCEPLHECDIIFSIILLFLTSCSFVILMPNCLKSSLKLSAPVLSIVTLLLKQLNMNKHALRNIGLSTLK